MEWQPIETAPKDGTSVLLGCDYDRLGKARVTLAWWDGKWLESQYWNECEEEWEDCTVQFRPTHWMPLPEPPTKGRDNG